MNGELHAALAFAGFVTAGIFLLPLATDRPETEIARRAYANGFLLPDPDFTVVPATGDTAVAAAGRMPGLAPAQPAEPGQPMTAGQASIIRSIEARTIPIRSIQDANMAMTKLRSIRTRSFNDLIRQEGYVKPGTGVSPATGRQSPPPPVDPRPNLPLPEP